MRKPSKKRRQKRRLRPRAVARPKEIRPRNKEREREFGQPCNCSSRFDFSCLSLAYLCIFVEEHAYDLLQSFFAIDLEKIKKKYAFVCASVVVVCD